jgi:FkbM family methyltransferase
MSWRHFLVKNLNQGTISLCIFGFRAKNYKVPLTRLGTDYGGWWIPSSILSDHSAKRVLVSAGLGHDVSFDQLALKAGFEVIGIDPIPECIAYAHENLKSFRGVKLLAKGLWVESGTKSFYSPNVVGHDSFSITNSHHTAVEMALTFDVVGIHDLFQENTTLCDVNSYIYLKMDIEGAELAILGEIANGDFPINFLAAEIDALSLISFLNIRERFSTIIECRRVLKKLGIAGYDFIYNENYNFFWVKR